MCRQAPQIICGASFVPCPNNAVIPTYRYLFLSLMSVLDANPRRRVSPLAGGGCGFNRKCYINAYHSNPEIIKQVIDKIVGESEFKGKPNDLVWAGKWQAKL
jgi:hypothetical protein